MPENLEPYTYRVVSVPLGCTKYSVDQMVELWVSEPPPEEITLGGSPPCAGTELELVE